MPVTVKASKSCKKSIKTFLRQNFSSTGENQEAFYATLRRGFNLVEGQEDIYLKETFELNDAQIQMLALNWSQAVDGQNKLSRWYSMGIDLLSTISAKSEYTLIVGEEYLCSFVTDTKNEENWSLIYEMKAKTSKVSLANPMEGRTPCDISFKIEIKFLPEIKSNCCGLFSSRREENARWDISVMDYTVDCPADEKAFWQTAFEEIPNIITPSVNPAEIAMQTLSSTPRA